jgi:phosphopantothenoylcysteine decarboxylase
MNDFLKKLSEEASVPLISGRRKRCLIGCSGSVACLKVPEISLILSREKYDVCIVVTVNGKFFLDKAKDYNKEKWNAFVNQGGLNWIVEDKDEWNSWSRIGDPVIHIELRRWADVFLIAPASADLIAKSSAGITDNLLLSIMRAWDFKKPCIICPAMNTYMWYHPSTIPALNILESWGWKTIFPVEKRLACNDVGSGALAPASVIVENVMQNFDNDLILTNNTETGSFRLLQRSAIGVTVMMSVSFFLNLCNENTIKSKYTWWKLSD